MRKIKFLTLYISIVVLLGMTMANLGCLDTGDEELQVRIIYEGSWVGSIRDQDGMRTISGSGNESFSTSGDIISANAQKQDSTSREITIQIVVDGEVKKERSCTEKFGIVQVTYGD